jgi:4-aminobutyrate aminotransferase-like enzyme
MSTPSLLERRFRSLGRNSPLFYEKPLQLVRGEGVWVYDADGTRYLDAYNNVPHVGHCHPRVVEALCKQAATLNSHTRYLDETVVTYAERLLATFHPLLERVFFTCTGSESNELAMRIARECTGHMGVISSAYAYHGNTAAVAQLSSVFTPPSKRGPFVRNVPVPDPYRERKGRSDADLADAYVEDLQRAIHDFERTGIKLAAVLFCTAFSSEGLPDLPRGYLPRVAEVVHRAGGLVIADEVQAGFGRFGSHMWGHDMHEMVPDIVTLGKPMGNGHPLAGVVTTADLMDRFTSENMYFNTFGGNEVSSAVGLAVLDVLRDERLLENAQRVGDYVIGGMRALQKKHPLIGDVRGRGMFFGVEIVKDRQTQKADAARTKVIVNTMRQRGVLLSRIGLGDNILKIRPPMPFSQENADLLLTTLDGVLSEIDAMPTES